MVVVVLLLGEEETRRPSFSWRQRGQMPPGLARWL